MHGILAKRIPGSCNVRAKSNCCWIRSTLFSASRSSSPVSQRHGNFLRDNLTYSPGLLGFCCLFNRATRDALAATLPLSTRTPDSRRSLKLPGRAAVEWKSIVSFYHTFSFFDLRGLPLHFFYFFLFYLFCQERATSWRLSEFRLCRPHSYRYSYFSISIFRSLSTLLKSVVWLLNNNIIYINECTINLIMYCTRIPAFLSINVFRFIYKY